MGDGMASVALDAGRARTSVPVKRGAIVAGFDVHRRQITFDALDTETGEVVRGRIADRNGAGPDVQPARTHFQPVWGIASRVVERSANRAVQPDCA